MTHEGCNNEAVRSLGVDVFIPLPNTQTRFEPNFPHCLIIQKSSEHQFTWRKCFIFCRVYGGYVPCFVFQTVSSITGDFWEIWEASTVGLGWQNPSPNLSKEKLWVFQTWFQWHGHRPRISPGSRAHLPPASILCLDLLGSRSLKEGYSFGRIAILPEMFAS